VTRSYTQEAVEAVAPLWGAILEHPFITGLRDGTLPDASLIFYFEQNIHYIDTVVRCRTVAASKARTDKERNFFLDRAPVVVEELQHQRNMLASLGGNPNAPIAPACHGYTRHILSLAWARKPVEYFGAFLPCPLSYDEIGRQLKGKLKKPVHQDWWAFYSSREHNDMCGRYRAFVDELAADLSSTERQEMLRNFVLGSKYEYWFWDMAYNRETW
jgi:thiaminase (transcriptional activator TenA)